MSLAEIDTRKNTALEFKHEWVTRSGKHNYLEDALGTSVYGKNNWNCRSTYNKIATANSQWNGTSYWSTNVTPIKAPEGPRNFSPIQLHPVMKPENSTPWAPFKFNMPTDNYRTTVGKYIQY